MGKYYCCMPECSNFKGKIGRFEKQVTLHKIPKTDPVRRKAWINAISRKRWAPTEYTRVCSDHFKDGIGPSYLHSKNPTENLAQKTNHVCSKVPTPRKPPINRSPKLVKLPCATTSTAIGDTHTEDSATPREQGPLHALIGIMHAYSKPTESGEADKENDNPNMCSSVSVQTDQPDVHNVGYMTQGPEITIEDIHHSDELIQFYSGLQNRESLYALFNTLVEFGVEGDCDGASGPKRKLRTVDEFVLVMMRLRLGLLVKDLAYIFKISDSTVSRIFVRWITFMSKALRSLVQLPSLTDLQLRIPKSFECFSDTRIILDCTEIYVQTPSSLENQKQTYSHYKSHNTFKALVGISMTGATVFVPKLYGGSTSDVEITRNSGLYGLLHPGDAVMVDKGFLHIKSDLEKIGCKLYCPPLKFNDQFTKPEVESTRRIASARIHVERKMEQIKNFRLLQGVMPLALNHIADDIFFVCAALTNLLPPLVK